MPDPTPHPDLPDPVAPDAFVRALTRAHRPPEPIQVPREIDDRIAAMARWRLAQREALPAATRRPTSIFGAPAQRQRPWMSLMRPGPLAAAAAAVLLIAFLAPRMFAPARPATTSPGSGPGLAAAPLSPNTADIDGNGRIDILDAFALARSIRDHSGPQDRWDVNGDGIVDQADVTAIATTAVRLPPAPPTPGGAG